jgi:hypothetical protein
LLETDCDIKEGKKPKNCVTSFVNTPLSLVIVFLFVFVVQVQTTKLKGRRNLEIAEIMNFSEGINRFNLSFQDKLDKTWKRSGQQKQDKQRIFPKTASD